MALFFNVNNKYFAFKFYLGIQDTLSFTRTILQNN